MKKNILLDTSVMMTYFTTKDTEKKNTLISLFHQIETKKIRVFSIHLIEIELANALRFSIPDQAERSIYFENFYRYPIQLQENDKELIALAMQRAEEVGDTVYDALYHVTAQALDATFLTCDKKYYERAKQYGDIELIG